MEFPPVIIWIQQSSIFVAFYTILKSSHVAIYIPKFNKYIVSVVFSSYKQSDLLLFEYTLYIKQGHSIIIYSFPYYWVIKLSFLWRTCLFNQDIIRFSQKIVSQHLIEKIKISINQLLRQNRNNSFYTINAFLAR